MLQYNSKSYIKNITALSFFNSILFKKINFLYIQNVVERESLESLLRVRAPL
jgi:hypothetical protein